MSILVSIFKDFFRHAGNMPPAMMCNRIQSGFYANVINPLRNTLAQGDIELAGRKPASHAPPIAARPKTIRTGLPTAERPTTRSSSATRKAHDDTLPSTSKNRSKTILPEGFCKSENKAAAVSE
jgi:hypothetical protein